MEIGGYRELDLRKGNEYYRGEGVARLNTGRAGILYALRHLKCNKVYLPYYECSTVRNFLIKNKIKVNYYHISECFRPIIENAPEDDTAVLIVNYFGLLPQTALESYVNRFGKVIIDNTQAFFCRPVKGAYSVYSARKFFGVSDGSYVIGDKVDIGLTEYLQDISEDTCSFLLRRIESGGNNNYDFYLKNEQRLEESDVRRMSKLTQSLLDNIDYGRIIEIRKENFAIAKKLFSDMNQIHSDVLGLADEDAVPMVYPLIIESNTLRKELKKNSIFVGQWWKYILNEMRADSVEYYFSKYLFPIQIDQRYTKKHIEYEKRVVRENL